jgi:hypothetical protein
VITNDKYLCFLCVSPLKAMLDQQLQTNIGDSAVQASYHSIVALFILRAMWTIIVLKRKTLCIIGTLWTSIVLKHNRNIALKHKALCVIGTSIVLKHKSLCIIGTMWTSRDCAGRADLLLAKGPLSNCHFRSAVANEHEDVYKLRLELSSLPFISCIFIGCF